MSKQEFFSWLIYSVIKKGAINPEIKHVGGVVLVSYTLDGVKQTEEIAKTDSVKRGSQYKQWFSSCIANA